MIIIAGTLRVDPADRDTYLAVVAEATALARNAAGCLDFAQPPDPLDAGRINILERWETDAHLDAFRPLPGGGEVPPILSADVQSIESQPSSRRNPSRVKTIGIRLAA